MTKPTVFWTKHTAGITAMVNGVPVVISSTNPNYDLILADLKADNFESLARLSNAKAAIQSAAKQAGTDNIRVDGSRVMWKNNNGEFEEVRGALVDRIVQTIRDGSTKDAVKPLLRLLSNIARNKHKDIRTELYEFLTSGKMPITEDGCFLAYKKIRKDYKDIYTGTMDNSPGTLVAMDEAKVDPNRNNTCSVGLHFCSRGYLPSYGTRESSTVVIVKVNPRHVFAIPTDYKCAKGRASEYYVVGEALKDPHEEELFLQPFIYGDNVEEAVRDVKWVNKDKGKKVTVADLKPTFKALTEGYGFVVNGRVHVRFRDTKKELDAERYSVVVKKDNAFFSAITGKEVPAEHVKELSAQTKSVRGALARAVARRRSRG